MHTQTHTGPLPWWAAGRSLAVVGGWPLTRRARCEALARAGAALTPRDGAQQDVPIQKDRCVACIGVTGNTGRA
eukprot:12042169-Alexandrium_andersonii.AAC.1